MTRDDVINELLQGQKMPEPVAHCGLSIGRKSVAYFDGKPIFMTGPVGNNSHPDPLYTLDQLRSAVAAAILCEREECAKVCSAQVQIEKYGHAAHAALMCENAIRARGTPSLACAKCGVDRMHEACKQPGPTCPLMGEAQ